MRRPGRINNGTQILNSLSGSIRNSIPGSGHLKKIDFMPKAPPDYVSGKISVSDASDFNEFNFKK